MSIRERTTKGGVTNYQVRWREEGKRDGKTCSASFSKKLAAEKFMGLVLAAGKRYPEGWVPGAGWAKETSGQPTLGEWFDKSVEHRPRANERTKADYRRDFARYVPAWLADKPVDQITKMDTRRWITELQQRRVESASGRIKRGEDRVLSEKSVHNLHGMVSSAMNDAKGNGLIPGNPFEGLLNAVPIRQEEMVFLTPAEFERFNGYVSPHFQEFVRFLFGTGLRWGEATALMVDTVDLEGARLSVVQSWKRDGEGRWYIGPPKTRRSRRTIALSPAQVDMLRPRVEGKRRGTLVWLNTAGRRILPGTFYNNIWIDALDRADEDDFTKFPRVHDLRHSHASLLLNSGRPLLEVSRRLGHESTQITADRYGHVDGDAGSAEALTALGL